MTTWGKTAFLQSQSVPEELSSSVNWSQKESSKWPWEQEHHWYHVTSYGDCLKGNTHFHA